MSEELLRIEYAMDRVLWQDPDQDQLDVWTVTLQLGRASDDNQTGVGWEGVANATLYGLDTDRSIALGQAPFDVADAYCRPAGATGRGVMLRRVRVDEAVAAGSRIRRRSARGARRSGRDARSGLL